MLKKLFFTFIIFFVLLGEPLAQSIYTYVLDYNTNPTVSWDDTQTGLSRYELRLVGIKPSGELVEFPIEQVEATLREKLVYRPRSGDFKVQVRACNTSQCSEWADSKDPEYATVNGQPMGWIIRWKVPKPKNIIIGFWNKLQIYLIGGEENG